MNVFHATNLTQDATEYVGQSVNGTGSIQNVFARRAGGWAARLNPTGAAVGVVICGPIGPQGNLSGASPVTDSFFRTYFAYLKKAATNYEFVMRFDNFNGTQSKFYISLDSLGRLSAYDMNKLLLGGPGTALALGQFYRIEVHVGTGNPGVWEILVDGVSYLSGTGNLNTTGCGVMRAGKAENSFNNAVDYYFTDTLWNDTAYPGAGQGAILVPVGNGFYTNGVANGAGQLWQCVNSVPPDDDLTYINGLSSGQAYTALVSGSLLGTINTYKAYARLTKDGVTASNQSLRMRSGGIDTDTTSGPISSYSVLQKIFDKDPATSATWTLGGINSSQVGILQSDSNPCRVTSLYGFVDYVPTLGTAPAVVIPISFP